MAKSITQPRSGGIRAHRFGETARVREAVQGVAGTGAFSLFLVWLGSYAAIAVLNIWLWSMHHAISSELLWLQAQRRLIMDISPPALDLLIQVANPLPLYLVLLAGSALNAAALLGATAFTLLAWQLRHVGAPRIWLLLVVLHPVLLLALAQWPHTLVRSMLLVVALLSLYNYLRDNYTYQALVGALALGGFALADARPWALLFYIAIALVIAKQRSWREHVTVLLITLFPAVCVLLGWSWLRMSQGGLIVKPSTNEPSLWLPSRSDAVLLLLANGGFIACAAFLLSIWWLLMNRRTLQRTRNRFVAATVMLLAVPLVEMFWLRETTHTLLFAVVLPLLALPLYAQTVRSWRVAQGVIGTLLVIGLFVGWNAVLHSEGEPHRIVAQAIGEPVVTPYTAYQAIADELNVRLQPGQRVLMDSAALAPLIPLVENAEAFLVPQQREYPLALQAPEQWARFIVVDETRPQGVELAHYQRVLSQDHIALYELH